MLRSTAKPRNDQEPRRLAANWHIWQHNDNEGDRTTQAIIQELGEGYTVGTVNHLHESYNDLNDFWTDASDISHAALSAKIKGVQPPQKSYGTSAIAEARPDE